MVTGFGMVVKSMMFNFSENCTDKFTRQFLNSVINITLEAMFRD